MKIKTKLLKEVGILFLFSLLFIAFVSMKAQAAQNQLALRIGDQLKPGDVINYKGTIYLCDQFGTVADSAVNSLTVKEGYVVVNGERPGYLVPTSVVGIRESTRSIYIRLKEVYLEDGCNHSVKCIMHKWNYDMFMHTYECVYCGSLYQDDHDFANGLDAPCRDCGFVMTCNHDWKIVALLGEHYFKCELCKYMYFEKHACEDRAICGVCGGEAYLEYEPLVIVTREIPEVPTEKQEAPVTPVSDIEGFAPVFNAAFYSEVNADLKNVFGNDEVSLFNHFVFSGMAEGRVASAEFNVHTYRANNPDLVVAFGDDLASYYWHYINNGKAEGRVAR